MDTAQIYGLIDPRDRLPHYVGSAVDAVVRFDGHWRDTADTPKTRWIAELKASNLRPELVILATVPVANRFVEEYKWIYLARVSGWPLTNTVAMKSNKYTSTADDLGRKVFVELERGLTWSIVRMCVLDMHSLPAPWDIRYAMLTSFSVLATVLFLASTLFWGKLVSEDLLTFLVVMGAVAILILSVPVLISTFKRSIRVEEPEYDMALIRQQARDEVAKMYDAEMKTMLGAMNIIHNSSGTDGSEYRIVGK